MDRRTFLQSGPHPSREAEQSSPLVADLEVLRVGRMAMATHFEILLPQQTPLGAVTALAALDLVDDLEDQLTVFRETSEVSQLNQRAATQAIEVEPRLFGLLECAASLTHQTQGCFDITTGALTKAWGFYRRSGRVPTVSERADAMNRTGMRYVILDRERRTVRFLRAGLEINLGGIGKGYALDRVREWMSCHHGISSALLHGGTSSVLAMGNPPGTERGWPIAIRHPQDSGRLLGIVDLRDQALGTSAATYQHFLYNGRTLGHLLDPRKGWPAEGVQQVSVIAPTAAEADALSTAFFVMGPDAARRYCESRPDLGFLLLPEGETAEPILWNTNLRSEL